MNECQETATKTTVFGCATIRSRLDRYARQPVDVVSHSKNLWGPHGGRQMNGFRGDVVPSAYTNTYFNINMYAFPKVPLGMNLSGALVS